MFDLHWFWLPDKNQFVFHWIKFLELSHLKRSQFIQFKKIIFITKLTKSSSLKNPLIPASYFWTSAPVLYLSPSTCIFRGKKTFSGNEILWTIHDNVSGTSVSSAFPLHIWSQKYAILIWTPCFLDIVSNTLQKNVPPGKVSGKAVQPQRRDLWAVFEHSWELLRDRKSEQWTTLSSPPPLSFLRPRHHWKV